MAKNEIKCSGCGTWGWVVVVAGVLLLLKDLNLGDYTFGIGGTTLLVLLLGAKLVWLSKNS
ncbi:MAG: hypothetical protein AABX52_01315 [Nanoarchaeota archaeon]